MVFIYHDVVYIAIMINVYLVKMWLSYFSSSFATVVW